MAYYEIGAFLKRMRVQKGLSQKRLARGICEPYTLSRIETGRQLPSKKHLDALMARLGLNAERYFSTFLCSEDYETAEMQNQLSDYIRLRDFKRAKELALSLEGSPAFQKDLNRQFLLHALAAIGGLNKNNYSEVRETLLDAIHTSIPNFNIDSIQTYLLTGVEIKIINMLAATYSYEGQTEETVRILYALKESIDSSYVNRRERAQNYPMVLYNLSKFLGLVGRIDDALKICEEAEAICIENDNLIHLPKILFNKAYCLYQMGNIEPCERLINQAYWCCDMIGKYGERDSIKEYAQGTMGISLRLCDNKYVY